MLLIDEVDKADLEFPNDLLRELDEMRFSIVETAARRRSAIVAGAVVRFAPGWCPLWRVDIICVATDRGGNAGAQLC